MKAVYFKEHGGPEKLLFGEIPNPEVGENEVLVRVKACALNHLDIWVRNGIPAYPVNLPHILGSDISGELVSDGTPVVVSPGISCLNCVECRHGKANLCKTFHIIGAKRDGGYAEFISVPVRNIRPKPAHLSFEEAASFPLVFLTAYHMLISRAKLEKGQSVVVLGAGSGVGSAAIQIAKVFGAVVYAVSSTEKKLENARKLGADVLINGEKEDFSEVVRRHTNKRGAEIVFEHVGPATWEKSIRSLSPGGKIVTCGGTTGPIVSLDLRTLFTRDLAILGSKLGTESEFDSVLNLLNEKKLQPVVSRVFPLSQAKSAHEFLERKEQFGKVVLKI